MTTGALAYGEAGECGETTVLGYAEECVLAGECSSEGDIIAGFRFIEL